MSLRDRGADGQLGAFEAHVEHVRDATEQRDGGGVVARHERGHLGDAGGARVRDQLLAERRPDAALLVLVGDREGDLGGVAVAYEPCDRDRPRVAVDVRDERRGVSRRPRRAARARTR